MNTQINLTPDTLTLQLKYLTSNIGLYNLFDKIQAQPLFIIPENSLVIDLTNITFGPNRYTVVIPQTSYQSFRIIYYSLLYFIFEKNPENKGTKIYQNLLSFILKQDLSVMEDVDIKISDHEVKTYLLKFLNMLQKARCKHKIIAYELSNLPQMDFFFLHLIKLITQQSDLMIQRNASTIHSKIKQNLGFEFQFLNNQTFAFQGEFIVDIRNFNQSCQFYIRRQNQQVVSKLKIDIMLQESARFTNQEKVELCGSEQMKRKNATKIKVTKKSTIKSVQWTEETCQEELDQKKFNQKQNPESIQEIKSVSFLDKIPFAHKKEYSNISNDDSSKIKRMGFEIRRFQIYDQYKNNFGLNFSDKFTPGRQKVKNISAQVKNYNFWTNKTYGFQNIIDNKSSLNGSYGDSYMRNQMISTSFSTKCIKSDSFSIINKTTGKQIKIPSFIRERANAKRQKMIRCNQKLPESNIPKITFAYKNK